MLRQYIHFGPFHKELRTTIADILSEYDGEIDLEKLKRTVKESKGYSLQERIITFEDIQQDTKLKDIANILFRYLDGTVYLY